MKILIIFIYVILFATGVVYHGSAITLRLIFVLEFASYLGIICFKQSIEFNIYFKFSKKYIYI